MNIYIWYRLAKVSNSWHPEGGLAVVAATQERANEIANALKYIKIEEEDLPDIIYALALDPEEKVITFPDAGCC